MIDAVGVVVPARDEASRIGACLEAIGAAAATVSIPVVIVVAADSCRDDTASVATRVAADVGLDLQVVACRARSAGVARGVAARRLGTRLASMGMAPAASWIACTDADTVVPRDWLRRQLGWAARGRDAVAGLVELPADAPPGLRAAFDDAVSAGERTHGHRQVHAANLGLRLSSLEAAGGFPTLEVGEDHALWSRLARGSARLTGAADLTVVTSNRLHSHTVGGFASFLACLHAENADGEDGVRHSAGEAVDD